MTKIKMEDIEKTLKYLSQDSELHRLFLDIGSSYKNNHASLIRSEDEFKTLQESEYEKILYIDFSRQNVQYIPINITKCINVIAVILSINTLNNYDFLEYLPQIKILILESCTLGKIPERIFDLKELKFLCLNDNFVSVIPERMKNLAKLEYFGLSLSHGFFRHKWTISKLPKEIYELSELHYLELSGNDITKISPEITRLKKLKYLDLEDNAISLIEQDKIRKFLPTCEIIL